MLKLQRMVFCTQFVDGCRKLYAATLISSAPADGRMRPKHLELRKLQQIHCCIKLVFHFISFSFSLSFISWYLFLLSTLFRTSFFSVFILVSFPFSFLK